jgi:hypothetical protein
MNVTIMEELEAVPLTQIELENLRVLIAARVLSFKNGSITVHYDNDGIVQKVDNYLVSYKRRS